MGPGACIVNIADVAGERPFRNHVPYCISKAGVLMLTRSLAKAWAPDVRVNAISPGTVLFRDDEDEAMRRIVVSRIPLGRVGTPEDVARAVVFLVDQADHTTGTVLNVDGGRSLD
jgi:pteridine reductase